MPILVTGAAGQLGSELCTRLGDRALGIDLGALDLTDADRVKQFIESHRPEAVINCAAYTAVDRAEQEPERCHTINAGAVAVLAEACSRLNALLVQISTDYVCGGDVARRTPHSEQDAPAPLGVYGQSKLAGERNAASWRRHLIIRSCGLYAAPRPGQHVTNFAQTMLRLGRERGRVRVVADQICSPTYVPNLAAAISFLLDQSAVGLFHVVDRGAVTWCDFAQELFRQAGMNVTVEAISTAEYIAERSGVIAPRPTYSVLDTANYDRLAGPPMPAWQASIAAYLDALQSSSDLGPHSPMC
jgi:dTDP-4-dehydrorhamnose reductase